jgi:dihydrolipoamide dehydrogenase
VVDREHLGGICLNWGCIPTKALLRTAEIYHYMQHAKEYGLSAEKVSFDPKAVVQRSRGVSQRLNGGVGHLMKKNKIDVIWGEAAIDAAAKGNEPGRVTVKESARAPAPKGALGPGAYQAKHIVVATGARPRVLPGIEPDQKLIWTYYEAMVPPAMPKSLLVMGSGAIGIEFASFYRTMGSGGDGGRAPAADSPVEDAEIAALARKRFEKQGIKILTGAKVTKVEKGSDSSPPRSRTARARRPITAERTDLGRRRRRQRRESRPRKARGQNGARHRRHRRARAHQRARALRHRRCRRRADARPQGRARGRDLRRDHQGSAHPRHGQRQDPRLHLLPPPDRVGRNHGGQGQGAGARHPGRPFPLLGNGKAIALGEPDGLVKTIFDRKTGQLLGAHMVGAEVTS